MTTSAPTLETERLILRGPMRDDFQDSVALWSDPDLVRYVGGKTKSREDVWLALTRFAGSWPLMGYGFWVVREKTSGRLVGEVGVSDFHRTLEPPVERMPEAGWVLAPWSHGRGYATEAMAAAFAWFDEHVGAPRTFCIIAPENAASVRVAVKCGYRESHSAKYKDDELLVFFRD